MRIVFFLILSFNAFSLTKEEAKTRLDSIKDFRGAMWKAGIEASNDAILKKEIIKNLDEKKIQELEAGDVAFEAWAKEEAAKKEQKLEKRERVKNRIKQRDGLDPDIKEALEVLIEEVLK